MCADKQVPWKKYLWKVGLGLCLTRVVSEMLVGDSYIVGADKELCIVLLGIWDGL